MCKLERLILCTKTRETFQATGISRRRASGGICFHMVNAANAVDPRHIFNGTGGPGRRGGGLIDVAIDTIA